jgi:hypothetical protein
MHLPLKDVRSGRTCRSCFVGSLRLESATHARWVCAHCGACVELVHADEETHESDCS